MKRFFLLSLILATSLFQAAFAEKVPVRISLSQTISTHHDEIETADYVGFVVVKDVYVDGKLFIKDGTPIVGFVDFFHPNGWAGDSAEIKIKTFETIDINDKKVVINYPLNINGCSLKSNDIRQYFSWVLTGFIRGSEIYLEPDKKSFNIFIES